MKRRRGKAQKGIAVILTAIVLLVTVPIVGLGIDLGLLYLAKAKLSSACDAAALAAARNLHRGLTLADQEQNARDRAVAYFDANYPSGFMNSKGRTRVATVAETAYRLRTVTVTGTTVQPLYFMRLLGYDQVTVGAFGRANRRDVNLLMVLDRSGSMQTSGACTPMKTAARDFLTYFANGRDRLGLITYSSGYHFAVTPTMNFYSDMDSKIASITCNGGTGAAAAVSEAYEQIRTINEPGVLNLIVMFTDGVANGVYASYPVKRVVDTRYGNGETSYSNTGTLYSMQPSPCKDSAGRTYPNAAWNPANKVAVMVGDPGATGTSWGLYAPTNPTITSNDAASTDSSSCSFASSVSNRYRRDIAYIPDSDIFGNNLRCCYKSPATFTSGPYTGYIRPDTPRSVQYAAGNACDNLAARVRADGTLSPVIYTIGLGTVDEVLLKRMANDPASPIHDPAKMVGMYAYAPDPTQLSRAFAAIASEILRLAR
jgi:Flp pilus assembly protein TadG